MKPRINILFTLLALSPSPCLHAQDAGDAEALRKYSFEEIRSNGRPKGWKFFSVPKDGVGDVLCVTDGTAGEDTYNGRGALQFSFPEGTELAHCAWTGDVDTDGIEIKPGNYSCSFWVKAEDLAEGLHAWVQINGHDFDRELVREVARSGYLRGNVVPDREWTQITFPFRISEGQDIVQIVPLVFFKTSPQGIPAPVPGTTRLVVDEIEIKAE